MAKTVVKKEKKEEKYGLSRYFLLTMFLSFLGWVFETTLVFFMTGKFYNQGFMTLPFCPIYGCPLILAYFLAGTPDEKRGVLKNVDNAWARNLLYLVFAFFLPTLAELIVGAFFDRLYGVWFWDYSIVPMNFNGYIALPVSLAWAGLLYLFMKFLFTPLKRFVGKIPKKWAIGLAILLFVAVATDMGLHFKNL